MAKEQGISIEDYWAGSCGGGKLLVRIIGIPDSTWSNLLDKLRFKSLMALSNFWMH